MILLAFFLPIAIYLLILAHLNNRDHPVLVAGSWDFAGILFAASGFLLLGGPAILSSLNERSRLLWMLGEGPATAAAGESNWWLWIFASLLYFACVVGGAGLLLWRYRGFTSIYNVALPVLERALQQAFLQAGVAPVRLGNLYLFGSAVEWSTGRKQPSHGIQETVHNMDQAPDSLGAMAHLNEAGVVLEVDNFTWLRHVTLHWSPAQCRVRTAVEGELRRILGETSPPDYVLSFWLTMLAQALFVLIFLGGLAVLIARMF